MPTVTKTLWATSNLGWQVGEENLRVVFNDSNSATHECLGYRGYGFTH
jgi:hypothetical protein